MSRRSPSRKREIPGLSTGLNLTPLLDIIFNLIFFFILATNITKDNRYLDLTLPQSSQGSPKQQEEQIPQITLTGDGTLQLDSTVMTLPELQRELRRRVQQENLTSVRFAGDARITYQQMIEVAEVCTAAGIRAFLPKMDKRVP
ncbi:MAG: ExbD/TolR family protein [Sumerlaeia bacterium]